MNFGELKSKLRPQIWASGEQENLIASHDSMFVESLYDLQRAVPCYRYGQTNVFDQCATYFNCGMTVLPAPQGHITSVYAIDRLNVYGEEDATADLDYCEKVFYQQIEYCHMERYIKLCRQCSSNIASVEAIATQLFGIYRYKRSYPAPDDAGMESLPPLPQGFHYPQASTDAAGRSPSGVWAIYRGRIYIAPWIQSTETVVIEWDGIKRTWADADLVDDDPKFHQYVRTHVSWQHEKLYGDPVKARDLEIQLFGTPPTTGTVGIQMELIDECNEENRVRSCSEAGTPGAAAARGLGNIGNVATDLYYNERQSYTATCPSGQTGSAITVVKEAGSVGSALSVADANARALQLAQDEANGRLSCEDAVVTYLNVVQQYTATCPGADDETGTPAATGTPVTATIPAGRFSSTVSQAAADAAALAAAQSLAESQLTCTYRNAEQSYTAVCPEGTSGSEVTETISAGSYSSSISQETANALALAAAQTQAEAQLSCGSTAYTIGNTPQFRTAIVSCTPPSCPARVFTGAYTTPANFFTKLTTPANAVADQLTVNQQAQSYALMQAQSQAQNQCSIYSAGCNTIQIGG